MTLGRMRILVETDVPVTLRDGVELRADVYRADSGGSRPALLMRTPYDKAAPWLLGTDFDVMRAVRSGFAVVIQDVRGRYASGGEFVAFEHEADDGADTIGWVAGQDWCDGRVALVGASYSAAVQWAAAGLRPAGLWALAPVTSASDHYEGWMYQGGAFQLGFVLLWALADLEVGAALRRGDGGHGLAAAVAAITRSYRERPLTRAPGLDELAGQYRRWLDESADGDWWQRVAPHRVHDQIAVPAFNVGGWHDIFLGGTLQNFVGMRARARAPAARELTRLVVGPWSHASFGGEYPERLVGNAGLDLTTEELRWLDHVVRGADNGVDDEPPVRLFVSGPDEWRSYADWPPPGTAYTDWYLDSDGRANTRAGDGRLARASAAHDASDSFTYDPDDPVPTVGGQTLLPGLKIAANAGPRDQRHVEERGDVLCYASDPLHGPLTLIGPVRARLHVSSTAPDTDFTAKLVDVHPDGRAELVTDGILRMRFRDSLAMPRPMTPGHVYEAEIDMRATAIVLPPGHRILLEVSSSNFPRFDRNSNTGGVIAAEPPSAYVTAVNTVHHGPAYRSRLTLPIAPSIGTSASG